MTTQEAVEKAIQGGWDKKMATRPALLDPLFWQALGKSLWLNDEKNRYDPNHNEWLVQWHMFIDHLADGGTIEDYFKSLSIR